MELFDKSLKSTDPRYSMVRDNPKYDSLKGYLEELWAKFYPFADNSFREDIAHQFHPRFWELYLGCTFLELGFELIPKETEAGPDIQILHHGRTIWVEATAPDKGTGDDAVPELIIDQVTQVPKEKVLLRFINSIYKKKAQLEDHILKGIVKEDDAFIIAINGFSVPHSLTGDEIPNIVRAVLPFGEEVIAFNPDTLEIIDERYQYRGEIKKKSGSLVPTTAFQDANFAGVSGIIYSNAELWNLPPSFGSDFLFFYNPLTTRKIKREWLRIGRYYWVEEDKLKVEPAV